MRIVQEKIDDEFFLELSLTPKELESLFEKLMIQKKVLWQDEPLSVGVKMETDEELFEYEDWEAF